MRRQKDPFPTLERTKPNVGLQVESKISTKKLMAVMQPEEGDTEELAKDFIENGGVITDVDEKLFLIEVDSGTFYISRSYVSRS